MMNIMLMIIQLLILLGLIYLIYKSKIIFTSIYRYIYYYTYSNYIYETFEQIKKLAYSKIFNEHAVIELTNNTKLNSEQINIYSREYIKLIYLFSGKIIDDVTVLYGSQENMIAYLTAEFVTKIIFDQLDKYSKEAEENTI